jgi:SAM-dependent methyltransferase
MPTTESASFMTSATGLSTGGEDDTMTRHRYDFAYGDQTAYAQVAGLIAERFADGDVVLDIGCGFGALADVCRNAGYIYVGLDADPEGLKDLESRGFESHQAVAEATPEFADALRAALAGRTLAGMLMLDVVEHLADADGVLAVLRAIGAEHDSAPLILCVPNVTHFDLGAKLVQGRWDQTEVGILDDTHVGFYSEALLAAMTQRAGWHEVLAADFKLEESDQHFPADNVALIPGTPLNSVLRHVRDASSAGADVCQFVRAYVPGPRGRTSADARIAGGVEPPFLSVLTRTQGTRLDTLQETLLCLAGQTCPDFEVLVLAHNVTPLQAESLGYLISSISPAVSGRFRVVPVTGPGRCRPLNVGASLARGRYVAVLDDDDLVMGNWVEEFRNLAEHWPGRVLRTTVAEQDISRGQWPDRAGYHVESGLRTPFPSTFDLFDHLVENHSPPCGLAIPRSCFRDLGLRFDESLPVLEDWDVLLQSVLLCGIATSPEVTSVYRRWMLGQSSTSVHSHAEWTGAHQAVIAKLDRRASIVPGGSITRVREMQAELSAHRAEVDYLRSELNVARDQNESMRHLAAMVEQTSAEFRASTSWRATRPLRALADGLRRVSGIKQAG